MAKFKEGDKVWISDWHQEGIITSVVGVNPEEGSGIQWYDVRIVNGDRTFYPTVEEHKLKLVDRG